MTITYDDEAPTPSTPKIVYEERRAAPSMKDSLLSLIAPGGVGRMTSAASKSFDKAAYDAGSGVAEIATGAGAPAPLAAGLGTAANVGIQTIPMFVGGGAGKTAAPLFDASGRRLMQSALKPTWADLKTGDAAKAVTTMLEHGVNATQGGVNAIRTKIADLNNQVKTIIANSPEMINKNAVANTLQETLQKFAMQVNPKADMKAIEKVWTDFLEHPALAGRAEMTIQEAQAIKQATDKALGSKVYGEMKGAEIEAQKRLRRGLKDEISLAEPATAALNKSQSELINAADIAQRRALMQSNNNPLPLGASIGAVAHDPLATLGLLANSSAWSKSMLARALFSGQERIPGTLGQLAGAGVGASMGTPSSLQQILDDLQRRQ